MTSSYGTSPPSSRLPPDGHEFPGDYLDDSSTGSASHAKLSVTRGGPAAGAWRSGGSSASTGGRDERSERSVRDKIALFTSEPTSQAPLRAANPVKYPPLSCSVDNLAAGRSPMVSPVARPSARTQLPPVGSSDLSERSRSLLDVTSNRAGQRKCSFEARRKSILTSKLRGLVIPDESKSETSGRPVIDLPEIISKDSVLVVGVAPLTPPLRSPTGSQHSGHDETDACPARTSASLSSLPWKSNSPSLPKYSPAFKRKELSVARPACYQPQEAPAAPSTKPPPPPPPLSTLRAYSSSSDVEALSPGAEDKEQANNSDSDSAVSSSRSSFSPANSPVPERRAQPLPAESIGGRVLKAQSVEALNRKNVLQSARFSSGGSSVFDVTPTPTPTPLFVEMRAAQRSGAAKSGDFEQALKKFAIAEAQSRIERTGPPRTRLSSSERVEVRTAMITDVCSEPGPGTPPQQRHEPKKPPVPDNRSAPSPVGKEIKSFRALAERWEAISTSDTSAGSSPPPSYGTTNNNNASVVNSNTNTNTNANANKKVEVKDEEKSVQTAVPRTVTTRSVSAGVVEIRKAFERVKEELETESNCGLDGGHDDYPAYKQHSIFALQHQSSASSLVGGHARMSSLDSTTSEDGGLPFGYGVGSGIFGSGFPYGYGGYGGPFGIGVRDNYGSITSLASSTSLISPQELQQLLDEANQSLEESGTPSHEIVVVVLHRGDVASSLTAGLGIALAGGADYETKEITIHKVIKGSVADRDGRIQKGDRVLSINGKGLKGVTHREALAILKAPRPEVVLVLSRNRSVSPQDIGAESDKDVPAHMIPASSTGLTSRTYISSGGSGGFSRPPRILESPSDFGNYDSAAETEDVNRGPPVQTTLVKDGAGLGFSLEGGKDSPLGDRPLTIKKIFTGGAASKNGTLRVGDQIISVNGCDVTSMSRIEAWNLMKKLPDGAVSLVIRQQLSPAS